MKPKTYVVAKTTYYNNGELFVQLQLYRRILEDGTDLRWNYNIGRDPIAVEDGKYIDVEVVRQRLLDKFNDLGISNIDVDYIF